MSGSFYKKTVVCNNICLSIFKGQTDFFEDNCIILIDKTDPLIPTKREDYWRQTLKTLAPYSLNIEESVWCFGLYLVLLSRF